MNRKKMKETALKLLKKYKFNFLYSIHNTSFEKPVRIVYEDGKFGVVDIVQKKTFFYDLNNSLLSHEVDKLFFGKMNTEKFTYKLKEFNGAKQVIQQSNKNKEKIIYSGIDINSLFIINNSIRFVGKNLKDKNSCLFVSYNEEKDSIDEETLLIKPPINIHGVENNVTWVLSDSSLYKINNKMDIDFKITFGFLAKNNIYCNPFTRGVCVHGKLILIGKKNDIYVFEV